MQYRKERWIMRRRKILVYNAWCNIELRFCFLCSSWNNREIKTSICCWIMKSVTKSEEESTANKISRESIFGISVIFILFFLAKEPQCILPFHPIKSEKVPAASGIPKMPVPCKNLQFCRQILWIPPEVTLQEQIHLKETRHQCEKLIFTKTDTTCLLFCFLRFNSENKLVLW